MKKKFIFFVYSMIVLLILQLCAGFSIAGDYVLSSTCRLVAAGQGYIVVISDSDGKKVTYKINKDTEFEDNDGNVLETASLKNGEQLTVTTEIGSDVALTIKKGLMKINMTF